MSEPRGIQERLDWFLSHHPSGPGMCAQHSWHSLGGNNGNPPPWGCSDANEVYDKVKKSGRYWTGAPKRGSLVLWRYGNNGHAAICYDDAGAKIATTNPDPDNSSGTATGVEDISYPSKWGASSSSRIYTDQYNGVRFPIGENEEDDVKHAFLYLSTTSNFKTGSTVTFADEGSDDSGFHKEDLAAIVAPWNSVGTYMIEAEGGSEVFFRKFDAEGKAVGDIGLSEHGLLTIVQDLAKGFSLRVIVADGTLSSAKLKADIRER